MKIINLKPHHLVCIPRYFSKGGYNKKYSQNFNKICKLIRKNPNIKIKIIKKCDDICKQCPYKKDNICKKIQDINYLINIQDNRVLKTLRIKNNSIHKAKDIFNLSINKINNKNLKKHCKIKYGCEFLKPCLKYNFNKSFIKDINKK